MERNAFAEYPLIYAGSVKNVRAHPGHDGEAVFEFTDAYSVFDWGKMPDAIPEKGAALAALGCAFFELLGSGSTWKAFFDGAPGRAFLAATDSELIVRARGVIAERERLAKLLYHEVAALATNGLPTHFRGRIGDANAGGMHVERLAAVKPKLATVLGDTVPDYALPGGPRNAPSTLIPLEVVFRFELTKASSLLARKPNAGFSAGQKFAFPYLECFTKLEDSDRALDFPEALAVGRIDAHTLEKLLLRTALTAAFIRETFAAHGLALLDGKFEWGLNAAGELILADAIGPDELRLTFDGVSLSKEILREYYRGTPWHLEVEARKKEVGETSDWHSLVRSRPEALPAAPLRTVANLYGALANAVAGKRVFDVPSLAEVAMSLRELRQ